MVVPSIFVKLHSPVLPPDGACGLVIFDPLARLTISRYLDAGADRLEQMDSTMHICRIQTQRCDLSRAFPGLMPVNPASISSTPSNAQICKELVTNLALRLLPYPAHDSCSSPHGSVHTNHYPTFLFARLPTCSAMYGVPALERNPETILVKQSGNPRKIRSGPTSDPSLSRTVPGKLLSIDKYYPLPFHGFT